MTVAAIGTCRKTTLSKKITRQDLIFHRSDVPFGYFWSQLHDEADKLGMTNRKETRTISWGFTDNRAELHLTGDVPTKG